MKFWWKYYYSLGCENISPATPAEQIIKLVSPKNIKIYHSKTV